MNKPKRPSHSYEDMTPDKLYVNWNCDCARCQRRQKQKPRIKEPELTEIRRKLWERKHGKNE